MNALYLASFAYHVYIRELAIIFWMYFVPTHCYMSFDWRTHRNSFIHAPVMAVW